MAPDGSPADTEPSPEFEALYEPGYAQGARMTPRMAHALWYTCLYLADTWRGGRDDPEPFIESLPPLARPLAHDEWYDRFTRCFDDLAARIAAGHGDREKLATCTGEEMALHLAIDLAEALVEDGLFGAEVDPVASLPDHGDDDRNFETMRSLLFTDHDVLVLFDPSMDGAEIAGGQLERVERYANLHPRDWFKPFAAS